MGDRVFAKPVSTSQLPLPDYQTLVDKAGSFFAFPAVTFDFHGNKEHPDGGMHEVEDRIRIALCSGDPVRVRDGLSNVLYWGYARRPGRRDYKVRTFRSKVQSGDEPRLDRFLEFVSTGRESPAGERLLALKKLKIPEFGQASFATKVLMFLDPGNYPVLDLKIARIAQECGFPPLRGLRVYTSIPVTKANAARYERWACWCCDVAARLNSAHGLGSRELRAVDIERAVFALIDCGRMDLAGRLLHGPQG